MSIQQPTLFLSVLVLSLLSSQVVSLGTPDISGICDKSIDRKFCLNFLTSAPGISSADLKGAGFIVLDAARAEATGTEKYIETLLGKATDPKTKDEYKTCLSNYEDALDNIATARESLGGGDYGGANIQASGAQANVDTCDEGVKGSELSTKNQHLFKVLGIVLIIANKLHG